MKNVIFCGNSMARFVGEMQVRCDPLESYGKECVIPYGNSLAHLSYKKGVLFSAVNEYFSAYVVPDKNDTFYDTAHKQIPDFIFRYNKCSEMCKSEGKAVSDDPYDGVYYKRFYGLAAFLLLRFAEYEYVRKDKVQYKSCYKS